MNIKKEIAIFYLKGNIKGNSEKLNFKIKYYENNTCPNRF
jgi:hypothetical protein